MCRGWCVWPKVPLRLGSLSVCMCVCRAVPCLGVWRACGVHAGLVLDKRPQMSNWGQRPLRPWQIVYAAVDAYTLLELHQRILALCATPAASTSEEAGEVCSHACLCVLMVGWVG
jgi:hypothetical protein